MCDKEITNYYLVEERDRLELRMTVWEFVRRGWVPVGAPFVHDLDSEEMMMYGQRRIWIQAMICCGIDKAITEMMEEEEVDPVGEMTNVARA